LIEDGIKEEMEEGNEVISSWCEIEYIFCLFSCEFNKLEVSFV
jgi:hypothetical protein